MKIYETFESDDNGYTEVEVDAAGVNYVQIGSTTILNLHVEGDNWHRTKSAAIERAIEVQRARLVDLTAKAALVASLMIRLNAERDASVKAVAA